MKKILVVENDLEIQEVVTLILEMNGYEVDVRNDGRCIMETGWTHPDAYLMNVMPVETSTISLCRHLKASAATQAIPVILLSTLKEIDSLAQAAGADASLVMPFNVKDLKEIVDHLI